MERLKSKEVIFVSFDSGGSWSAFEMVFNEGIKKSKSLKFQANRIWKSEHAPEMFAAFRASFTKKSEAIKALDEQVSGYGGVLRNATPGLVKRLEAEFGFQHNK